MLKKINGKSVSLIEQYCGVISLYDLFGQWGVGITLKEVWQDC